VLCYYIKEKCVERANKSRGKRIIVVRGGVYEGESGFKTTRGEGCTRSWGRELYVYK